MYKTGNAILGGVRELIGDFKGLKKGIGLRSTASGHANTPTITIKLLVVGIIQGVPKETVH